MTFPNVPTRYPAGGVRLHLADERLFRGDGNAGGSWPGATWYLTLRHGTQTGVIFASMYMQYHIIVQGCGAQSYMSAETEISQADPAGIRGGHRSCRSGPHSLKRYTQALNADLTALQVHHFDVGRSEVLAQFGINPRFNSL